MKSEESKGINHRILHSSHLSKFRKLLHRQCTAFIPSMYSLYIIKVRPLYPFHICQEVFSQLSKGLATVVMKSFHSCEKGIKVVH